MFFMYLQGDRGEDSTVTGGPVSDFCLDMQKCLMDVDFGINLPK